MTVFVEIQCCILLYFVVVVVVAHIYPPVTGQRQTLTCGTIRTLFIPRTTS